MKQLYILFLFITQMSFGQSSDVPSIIKQIDLQEDTIRAVYDWVTENIAYDVQELKKLKNKSSSKPKKISYKAAKDRKNERFKRVLRRKKGVCEDYSLLFDSLLTTLGYESIVVSGYIKDPKGNLNLQLGHAWNAVKVQGEWKLYDLTWGAGYVIDGKKFVRNANDVWYDVDPSEMIKRHMPYDPMWQLLESPIDYAGFKRGKLSGEIPASFTNEDVMDSFLQKDHKHQLQDQLARSKELNGTNPLVKNWHKLVEKRISYYKSNNHLAELKSARESSKNAYMTLSKYRDAKKNHFRIEPWSVDYARQQLNEINDVLSENILIYKDEQSKKMMSKKDIKKMVSQSNRLMKELKKELEFLEEN